MVKARIRCGVVARGRLRPHAWRGCWTDAPPPDDVRLLFTEHSGGATTMGADGLRRYLESMSGDPDAADDAKGEADGLLVQNRQGGHQRAGQRLPHLGRGQLLVLPSSPSPPLGCRPISASPAVSAAAKLSSGLPLLPADCFLHYVQAFT